MFDTITMSKATITRLFAGSAILVATGALIGTAAVIAARLNGAVTLGGDPFISIDPGQVAGAIVWLVVASIVAAIGTLGAIVSWAGALLNTYRLEDKTWFVSILGLGLVSLGWVAMFAYVLRGPDSTTARGQVARFAAS